MKKILIASALFFTSLSFANAQQAPAKVTEKKRAKVTTASLTTTDKMAPKVTTAAVSKTTDKAVVKTKRHRNEKRWYTGYEDEAK